MSTPLPVAILPLALMEFNLTDVDIFLFVYMKLMLSIESSSITKFPIDNFKKMRFYFIFLQWNWVLISVHLRLWKNSFDNIIWHFTMCVCMYVLLVSQTPFHIWESKTNHKIFYIVPYILKYTNEMSLKFELFECVFCIILLNYYSTFFFCFSSSIMTLN